MKKIIFLLAILFAMVNLSATCLIDEKQSEVKIGVSMVDTNAQNQNTYAATIKYFQEIGTEDLTLTINGKRVDTDSKITSEKYYIGILDEHAFNNFHSVYGKISHLQDEQNGINSQYKVGLGYLQHWINKKIPLF
jgi:uncharacterized protein YxeA